MAIIAGIGILLITLCIAIFVEIARGMNSAPSMHPSHFVGIMSTGCLVACAVAALHWLPG